MDLNIPLINTTENWEEYNIIFNSSFLLHGLAQLSFRRGKM